MKLVVSITRVLFALWLCIGTQFHLVVDHAALLSHANHHLTDSHGTRDASSLAFVEHDDRLCCYHTPQHQHHDGGVPHPHLTDALRTASSQRNLPFVHAAVLPLRILEALPQTAPLIPSILVDLPAEAPSTHNAALRAPPLV